MKRFLGYFGSVALIALAILFIWYISWGWATSVRDAGYTVTIRAIWFVIADIVLTICGVVIIVLILIDEHETNPKRRRCEN